MELLLVQVDVAGAAGEGAAGGEALFLFCCVLGGEFSGWWVDWGVGRSFSCAPPCTRVWTYTTTYTHTHTTYLQRPAHVRQAGPDDVGAHARVLVLGGEPGAAGARERLLELRLDPGAVLGVGGLLIDVFGFVGLFSFLGGGGGVWWLGRCEEDSVCVYLPPPPNGPSHTPKINPYTRTDHGGELRDDAPHKLPAAVGRRGGEEDVRGDVLLLE